MPRGYTTNALVAQELKTTLTSPQQTFCDQLIAEAEAWVDGEVDRQWLVPSPITNEPHRIEPQGIYLDCAPIVSVQQVRVRLGAVTLAPTTLVAGRDYEVLNTDRGLIWLAGLYVGWYALVDYTQTATGSPAVGPPVPDDLSGAVRRIVAEWMRQALGLPRPAGAMSAYSIGTDLRVEFATNPQQWRTIPPDDLAIVRRYAPLIAVV